jgi:TolB-like protein/Tfp pilus assembly protein PilF
MGDVSRMAVERVQRRLAAILSADVVGYSRLMGEDEAGALARLKELRATLIDPAIAEHRGRTVKLMGDGALVEFSSAVDAVECAVSIQRDMAERTAGLPDSKRIIFRIGVNLGDVIIDGDDIYGDGVNVAARIEGLAEPGGICVSGTVFDQVKGKLDAGFEDLGPQLVKNIAEPVRTYRVTSAGFSSEPTGHIAAAVKPSIAVLAFENIGGDPDQEYFSDGISEDIITALSHIPQFHVTARNSTFTYKGQAVDVRSVASELGVRYVLEGSVRKSGQRVRITAQLIDGESGNHLWAERYDRDLEDIFAVQDEITQTVVAALQPELTRSEIERARQKPPDSLDAWDLYQRGLWHLFRSNENDNAAAIKLFVEATEADPDFINPYVGLVEGYVYEVVLGYGNRNPQDAFAPARKAVEIDPQNASAHKALGMAYFINRDHPSAIAEFKLAIHLNPSDAHLYPYLGFAQAFSGLAEDALDNFLMAMKLSPRDPMFGWFHNGMGVSLLHLQRHEECVEWVRKALQYPNVIWAIRAYAISALAHLGRTEECRQELDDLLALQPDCTISLLQRSRLTTDQSYSDHFVEGLRKAGLPD